MNREVSGKIEMNFDIFGSCVSRDLFEYDAAKELHCKEYIARQSLLSLFEQPIELEEEELFAVKSNFQKKVLLNDFNKKTLERFEQSKSDFFLVDFIDERFNLIKLKKSYLTYSSELMVSHYLDGKKYKVIDKKNWGKRKLERNVRPLVERFAWNIQKIYKAENIVIHKARMLNEYIGRDGITHPFSQEYIEDNRRVNYILDNMYIWLERCLDNPKVIDVSKSYRADEKHKWGLAVMHYQPEYYDEVIETLKNFIKNEGENNDR